MEKKEATEPVHARALSPQPLSFSAGDSLPVPKSIRPPIREDTDLKVFSTSNVRKERIAVLVEIGRRVRKEHPNLPFESLKSTLIQAAMELWEVQRRTAKEYAQRALFRLEKAGDLWQSPRGVREQQEDAESKCEDFQSSWDLPSHQSKDSSKEVNPELE